MQVLPGRGAVKRLDAKICIVFACPPRIRHRGGYRPDWTQPPQATAEPASKPLQRLNKEYT